MNVPQTEVDHKGLMAPQERNRTNMALDIEQQVDTRNQVGMDLELMVQRVQ